MKTKKGFMLRTVADKHIVVPIGTASVEFNGLITLNETGAFLWERLSKGATYDELLSALLSEYDVSEADARKGLDAFIQTGMDANVIEN